MTTIKILGQGCANCLRLETEVLRILQELQAGNIRVQRIGDPREINHYLTGDPPGLMVNDALLWPGGRDLPSRETLTLWLRESLAQASQRQEPIA
jgi:hypothetical protein